MIRETTIFSEWIEQSRIEGMSSLLFKQLEKKLGHLPSELKEAVASLNAEQIDDLAMEIFDLNNIKDLRMRLHVSAMSGAAV